MTLSNSIPFDFETDMLNRRAVAQQQIDQGKLAPANVVNTVADISHLYPWLDADTNVGLAQAGVGATHPIVRTVANLSLRKKLRDNHTGKALKDSVSPEQAAGLPFGGTPQQRTHQAKENKSHDNGGGGFLGTGIDLGYTISRGLAGDPVGALAGPGKGALPDKAVSPGLPAPGGSVSDYLKPVVRTAGLAANTGLEAAQAGIRNVGAGINQIAQGNFNEAFNPTSQTNTMAPSNVVRSTQAGQAVLSLERGQPVDVGTGYLPDPNSATAQAALEVRRHAAPLIDGHVWTLGRAVANLTPVEPDSLAFHAISGVLDGAVAVTGDPTNAVISEWSAAREAHRFFSPDTAAAKNLADETGLLVTTARPSYMAPTQESFFASSEGQKGLQAFTDAKGPAEVWRASNGRLPVEAIDGQPILRQLAASHDNATTQQILQRTIDFQPTDMPSGISYSLKKAVDTHSFLNIAPKTFVQPRDPNTFLQEFDRLLATGHIPLAKRNELLNKYLTADTPDQIGNAIVSAGNTLEALALRNHADPAIAKKIGRLLGTGDLNDRAYSIDQITGLERARPGVVIDGAGTVMPSPELDTESINRMIQFPDPRLVRRATSKGAAVFTSSPWQHLLAPLDIFYDNWRMFAVAKPGTTIKITGDSQMSLAVNGYSSMFHPFHFISAMVGGNLDKAWAQRLQKYVPGINGEYIFGPGGEPIIPMLEPGASLDVKAAAMDQKILDRLGHPFLALEEPGKVTLNGFSKLSRDDPRAAEAMLSELNRMRGDPLIQGIIQQPDPQAAMDWFHSGEGSILREQYQKTADLIDANNEARVATMPGATHIPIGDLSIRENSDALVRSRLDTLVGRTGNHDALIDAVRTGKIDDIPIWKNGTPNPRAIPSIQAIFDTGGGPNLVKASREVTLNATEKELQRNLLRRGVRKYFNLMLGVPDHYFNQVPGWQQASWKHAEKYVPWLDAVPKGGGGGYLTVAVDDKGFPIQVYHGSTNEFEFKDFEKGKGNYDEGTAAYLSTSPEHASHYAMRAQYPDEYRPGMFQVQKGGFATRQEAEAYISKFDQTGLIKNQRLRVIEGSKEGTYDVMGWNPVGSPNVKSGYLDVRNPYDAGKHLGGFEQSEIDALKDQGYDSIKHISPSGNTVYVAFDPANQVKSTMKELEYRPVRRGQSEYEKFIKSAESAGLPDEQLQRIKNIPLDGTATKRITAGEGEGSIGYLAKANTIHEFENLTHNISNRANAFDALRFLFPFGDAFRLVAKRWAVNTWNHPELLRRLQQGVQEAQQSGFFHKDPITGQDVFTLPGSEWLTDQLFGVPVPLNGQVKGLNLIGEGYPGVGPAATLPAAWFLPDTPAYDKIRDVIFPMGPPRGDSVQSQLANQLVPGWLDKLMNSAPDQKTYNNTVGYMIRYLESTGDYDTHGPDAKAETNRMLDDAKKDAQIFYVVRAAAQFTSPSAPSPEWLVHDKTGNLIDLQVIKDKYHAWSSDPNIGPDKALTKLVKEFGGKNLFAAQAFSAPIGFGVPTTKPAQDWARNNPDVRRAYPNTYGLFAPTKGTFDVGAFEDQFTTGERESLTPEKQIARAENRIGQWIYFTKRDAIIKANNGDAPDKGQAAWLSDLKDYLSTEYPGFNSFDAMPYDTVRKRNTAISELTAAADDPKLAGTDAAQGLQIYLTARANAIAASPDYGAKTPFQSKGTAPLREWLRNGADEIVKDHPDFLPMWEQLFSHELSGT